MSSKKPIEMVPGVYRTHGLFKSCSPDDVFVMRNAQTVDQLYPDWVTRSKLDQNLYTPIDLNMPDSIPRRADNAKQYAKDPPLTEWGLFSANLVGKQLKENSARIRHIYCSPQLQSVQTASEVKRHFGNCEAICVDHELLSQHIDSDALLPAAQLLKCGFPVKVDFESDQVTKTPEPLEKTFSRLIQCFQNIVDEQEGSTLFVVDAPVMKLLVDYCARSIGLKKDCYLNRFDIYALDKKANVVYPPACILSFGWVAKKDLDKPVLSTTPNLLLPITTTAGSSFPVD